MPLQITAWRILGPGGGPLLLNVCLQNKTVLSQSPDLACDRWMTECVCWQRKLEAETQQLKLKLQSLQADYDNSEAVQQDFVKLSQSLQVSVTMCECHDRSVSLCQCHCRAVSVSAYHCNSVSLHVGGSVSLHVSGSVSLYSSFTVTAYHCHYRFVSLQISVATCQRHCV